MKQTILKTFIVIMLMNISQSFAATIEQSIKFVNTTPERLYQIYMSSTEHSAFTGAPAVIDPRVGGTMTIFGGHGFGKFFELVPGRLIVQSWRGRHFSDNDLDTTLILTFRKIDGGAEIDMTQTNVPDEMERSISSSWKENYWAPLKDYVLANP
jgi:activator of HSP90 ATPase